MDALVTLQINKFQSTGLTSIKTTTNVSENPFNPLTPNSAKSQNKKKQISFCKILKNTYYHTKVLLKRFHLNGHTIGFR